MSKQRKRIGILAVVISIGVLATGCIPQGDTGPSQEDLDAMNPQLIYTDPATYEEVATNAVMELYNDPIGKKDLFWLDTDLLIKEVVYSRTLIDEYNAGQTPDAIKEEVELLVELSNRQFSFMVPYEKFIGSLNSVYNMVANLDTMSFRYSRQCLAPLNTILSEEERIGYFNKQSEKYYDLAKVIHEGSCELDHSKKNEKGYNYCPALDEANEIAKSNSSRPYILRLSE